MPSTYKTPGVYIEEISKLPASVAQVATAIPAFIGFTEKNSGTANVPTKIKSLLEYEELFGGEATGSARSVAVTTDSSGTVTGVSLSSRFLLYQSLRLFYANGGGDAYIVSVGTYAEAADTLVFANQDAAFVLAFQTGVDALKKADEPTLLLVPDAYTLPSATSLAQVHTKLLSHCNNMQDRFAVLDVWHDPNLTTNIVGTDATVFRTGVGTQYLKYGAAYYPELNTTLGPNGAIDPTSFSITDGTNNTLEDIADAIGDTGLQNYYRAGRDLTKLNAAVSGRANALGTAGDKTYSDLVTLWEANFTASFTSADPGDVPASNTEASNFLVPLLRINWHLAQLLDSYSAASFFDSHTIEVEKNAILDTNATAGLKQEIEAVWSLHALLDDIVLSPAAAAPNALTALAATDLNAYLTGFTVPAAAVDNPYHAGNANIANVQTAVNNAIPILEGVYNTLTGWYDSWKQILEDRNEEATMAASSKLFADVVSSVQSTGYTLPPSGAIVGVYAAMDRNRGVWKAPANVSLNAVASLPRKMQASELDDLNIPSDGQGKSINAIRFFRGKGTLIYGARTLDGNSNEWRYVPVRRLFIMIEESIQKATESMVFEPNDANTWQKVRGMIENFLTGLWREGAFTGAKPEDAFYVSCALGETMTAQDILEGKMIIEIGVAAVRPAEFIILKFSHKMQES
ncbi:MAG: phage tail sheath C-terminal domain-containing protein [Bacteroidota bacterium]